jgi:hypothetical protein
MDRSAWQTRLAIETVRQIRLRASAAARSGLVHWPALKAWSEELKAWSEEEDEVLSPANLVGQGLGFADPSHRGWERCDGADCLTAV